MNVPVVIASFAPACELHDLQAALRRLDYQSATLSEPAALDRVISQSRQMAVLFIGSGYYPDRRILNAAKQLAANPSLAIVSRNDYCWEPELLDHCNDFACWPCHDRELALRLEKICTSSFIENDEDASHSTTQDLSRYGLFGNSPAFRQILQSITRLAQYDAPVLIGGETGTGKELCARAIHYLGPRKDQAFIPVNCGALPDTLIENELFGHEQGAFTDAKRKQSGLIAQAQGGSLFLDEIETLSLKGQVALLRFLEDFEYRPLGGMHLHKADVRLIVATNVDLATMVGRGEFRQDLYYRLNVAVIEIPALRERVDDIRLLAEEFIRQASVRYQQAPKRLDPATLVWMQHHDWPGNVRELENFIHRAYLTCEAPCIQLDYAVPGNLSNNAEATSESTEQTFGPAKSKVIREFEQRYLQRIMTETRGNVTLAAHRAGKERRAFGKLLKKHGLDRTRFS